MAFAFIEDDLGKQSFFSTFGCYLLLVKEGVPIGEPIAFDGCVAGGTGSVICTKRGETLGARMDAGWAREATKNEGREALVSKNTGDTSVTSGKCVPPR